MTSILNKISDKKLDVINVGKSIDDYFITGMKNEAKLKEIFDTAGVIMTTILGGMTKQEYKNKGVTFCPHCDGPLFKGKRVAVIGGGNSALEESIYLAGLARSVTIVIRRDVFRAEEHIQKQIEENAKIHVIKKHIPVQILSSEGKVSGIELENVDTHEKQVIECSGIFPYVGQDPNTDCVQDLGILNERGYVLVDDDRQTKIPGIYAAGDVIDKNLRQVITACNDGAIAAQHAFHKIKGI